MHVEEVSLARERADLVITERTKRLPLLAEHVDLVPRAVARAGRESGRRLERPMKLPTAPREEVELEEEGSVR